MYTNIINYINKQKLIKYETALDKYATKRDLIDFIDEYISELIGIQDSEDLFTISILSEFDPKQEMKRINDIFKIIEEKHRIYPRMYIYLHRDFDAISDAAEMVNKIDDAIDIFEELKDRVNSMEINDYVYDGEDDEEIEDSLKTILDDTNPVIGQSGYTHSDDIGEFVEIYAFMIEKIVEHDSIIKANKKMYEEYTNDSTFSISTKVDLSSTVSYDGFLCLPPILSPTDRGYTISHVDILLNLLHLMESDNVTKFWSKEINDVVESNNDYTSDWGYFSIHVPHSFQIEIPEQIRESMYKYIKFLSDQLEKYMSKYNPQLTHNKSKKYFGISMSDEFMYEFNNEVRDLLFDVYTYKSLIYENDTRLSKERFDKLLEMIDRTHGIISHNHIIIKFMLYYRILTNRNCYYLNTTELIKLLSLFEILYDYDHFTGNREDIDSIINSIERKYKLIPASQRYDRKIDKYETRLVCMVFNCTMIDDLFDNLKSKYN